ncbi:hypothetical protein ABW21_db0201411 [Orbilia brochopaga]|nr:hypothetical protein ABW21_db0201411 [Drechslerella brochopaga]
MVWDLRNANAPEKILTGHDQGVLSLDWCKQDPDILLSSGKDNRTICWNPNSGEMLGEFPIGTNWMFQTRLNPKNPNLVASASFDGKISIQSLQNKTQAAQKDSSSGALDDQAFFSQASFDPQGPSFSLKQAPRWYKRPVGASFGFGGKLVSFTTPAGQNKSTLKITTLAVESDVRSATDTFESALKAGNFVDLCEKRIEELSSESEKAEWTILKTLFDASPKKKLVEILGFTADPATDTTKTQEESSSEQTGDAQANGASKQAKRLSAFFGDGAEDDAFLNELSSTKGARTNNPFNIFGGNESEADKAITRALILGNFERAVDICITEDRLSDAFMLAVAGGEASMQKVQKAYFSKQVNAPNYLRLLSSVVGKNLWDVVHNADLADWKEVLCTICTFGENKEFSELCEALGERLEVEQKANSEIEKRQEAATCYLSGSRLHKIVGIWIDEYREHEAAILQNASEGDTSFSIHVKAMQQLIEKVTVFREATKFVDPDMNATSDWKLAPLYDIYCEYADVLAAQGQLEFAAKYLDLIPASYQPAQIARTRVNIASGKDSSKRTAASRQPVTSAASRAGAKSPYAPLSQQTAPTAPKMFTPVAPLASAIAPTITPQPQPQPSMAYNPATQPQATSRYTPAGSTAPTTGYQPTTTPNNSFGYRPPYGNYPSGQQTGGFGVPPPRNSSPGGPAVLPAAQRTDLSAWNDTPMVIDTNRRKTPSVPPATGPITTPFPGAHRVASPSPTGPSFVGPPPRASSASIPPPRPGQSFNETAPAGGASMMYRPQTPGSRSQSPYVTNSPSAGPMGTGPPQPRANAAYAAPPTATGPPSNRYTPQPSAQPAPSAIPPAGPGRGMVPPPSHNAYAPPPAAATTMHMYNQPPAPSPYNQPPPSTGPPTGPPPMTGPPTGPPRGSSAAGTRPESSHAPPKAATPRLKHPKGDRTHIPEHSRLLYEILDDEMRRIIDSAPADFKPQVAQIGKRLDVFFDHLNNDDLLTKDTIQGLTDTYVHVRNGDFESASSAYGNVPQTELGSFGAVHKKMIQLSQFARQ